MREIPAESPRDPIEVTIDTTATDGSYEAYGNECPATLQEQADERIQGITDDPGEVFEMDETPPDADPEAIAPVVVPGLTDEKGKVLETAAGDSELPPQKAEKTTPVEAPAACPYHETASQVGQTALSEAQEKPETPALSKEVQVNWPDDPNDTKGNIRALWELHKDDHTTLKKIMNDMAGKLATEVNERLDEGLNIKEATAAHKLHEIPGDLASAFLPPTAFGPLHENNPPHIPESRDDKERLATKLRERQESGAGERKELGLDQPYRHWWPSDQAPTLADTLEMVEQRGGVDPEKWQAYVEASKEQCKEGLYTMEGISDFRRRSAEESFVREPDELRGKMAQILGMHEADSVNTLALVEESETTPANYLVLPVGEYGSEVTEKLTRTVAYMEGVAKEPRFEWEASLKAIPNEEILLEDTARARTYGDATIGLRETVREGVLTTAQTLAFLSSHKVPGYESGEELIKDISEQGLVEQFTRSIPPGFIGPVTNLGHICPDIIENVGKDEDGNNKLRLNPAKLAALKEGQKIFADFTAKGWRAHEEAKKRGEEADRPEVFGLICPAALPNGGVTQIARTIARAI